MLGCTALGSLAIPVIAYGEHPKVVSEMLGHSSIKVTLDVYSHASLELQKQATARLNAALTGRE